MAYHSSMFLLSFLYFLGWFAAVVSQERAVDLYKRGNQLAREGAIPDAVELYAQAVSIDNSLHYAYTNWAHLLLEQGQVQDAVPLFLKAHQVAGTSKSACNLAIALHRAGQMEQAQQFYETALQLDENNEKAIYNIGTLLLERGELAEAAVWFDKLLLLRPSHAEGQLNRCNILYALEGATEKSEDCYSMLLSQHPHYVRALVNRASVLWVRGLDSEDKEDQNEHKPLLEEAAALFRLALELEPSNVLAQFGVLALGGGSSYSFAPSAVEMPADYVRQLFDSYAGQFDASLQGLGYATPAALADSVAVALQQSGHQWNELKKLYVLDLGCGTGLASAPLRSALQRIGIDKASVRLDGVDLSGGMLRIAKETGAYDSLTQADALAYLETIGNSTIGVRYHVVLAADVLVYFGDLSVLFGAVRKVLAPPGLFVFSVEQQLDHDGSSHDVVDDDASACSSNVDYVLQRCGRFAHSLCYVQRTAALAGLSVVSVKSQSLRMDRGRSVPGLLFVLWVRP